MDTDYDAMAHFYDAWHDRWPENVKANCIDALSELAGGGEALELGIGTGRLALPLAARGLRVSGVDSSEQMLARLRTKPGAERLHVACGDFAQIPLPGPFDLVYMVVSFGYLLTQEAQLSCFASVARVLAPAGVFVVQTVMPGERIFHRGAGIEEVFDVPSPDGDAEDCLMLLSSRTDLVRQWIDQRVIVVGGQRTRIFRHRRRYVWPTELDLMARIAGLELRERWGGWRREPFTAASPSQVSVYRRAGAGEASG
ncbi:MAG: class I SAM-dependent methyltransferase [Pseudomonas sp.]